MCCGMRLERQGLKVNYTDPCREFANPCQLVLEMSVCIPSSSTVLWVWCCWSLIASCFSPSNMLVYPRDGSAQTIVGQRAGTLWQKLQIKLSIAPSHSILTLGQPIPALIRKRQAPGRATTGIPILKWLECLDQAKTHFESGNRTQVWVSRGRRLTTRPARRSSGVKQSCLWSPQLFSLYVNEVALELNTKGRHGVQWKSGAAELFLLLFAGDVILLSDTAAGPQTS